MKENLKPNLRSEQLPLCVDLDQSLVCTDTLYEMLLVMLKRRPHYLFLLPMWMAKGRGYLKEKLFAITQLEPEHLPYNKDLLFFIKRMQKRGRAIYLVSGAPQKLVDRVAEYLGCFDDAYGSTPEVNLIGVAKAQMLSQKFGERGFEYVGDSSHDIAVWRQAHTAHMVAPSVGLAQRVVSMNIPIAKVFSRQSVDEAPMGTLQLFAKALRIHQWSKNMLIFAAALFAPNSVSLEQMKSLVVAFLAFSFTASAIYVLNDLLDLAADRSHPEKSARPFASGALSLRTGIVLVPLLLCLAALLATRLELTFALFLVGYLFLTTAYSFYLKSVPIADIVILASLYSMRILTGAAVTAVQPSPWLMACSGFFFLALATMKRVTELMLLQRIGVLKTSGRGYEALDTATLANIGTSSGMGAVTVLALYINSDFVKAHYADPRWLWMLCPLLIYWMARMWFITGRGLMSSDPVKFALKDRVSWICLMAVGVVWFFARYLPSTTWNYY